MDKRNLIYNVFVGAGDTSSFASVKEACYAKYEECYVIRKEECTGHIQKRMESGMREYKRKIRPIKLNDGKDVGGSDRLCNITE